MSPQQCISNDFSVTILKKKVKYRKYLFKATPAQNQTLVEFTSCIHLNKLFSFQLLYCVPLRIFTTSHKHSCILYKHFGKVIFSYVVKLPVWYDKSLNSPFAKLPGTFVSMWLDAACSIEQFLTFFFFIAKAFQCLWLTLPHTYLWIGGTESSRPTKYH